MCLLMAFFFQWELFAYLSTENDFASPSVENFILRLIQDYVKGTGI